jgi:transposase
MKDGRTHLAHKAEHAIDLDSGALVAVTLHGADVGDTTSLGDTVVAASGGRPRPARPRLGRSPRSSPIRLSQQSDPDRFGRHRGPVLHRGAASGRRQWTTVPDAQRAVYGNRRQVRGGRGQRWLRRRGEYVERSFAHVYDTGGMRRTHLRGHRNILKRLLVHASAFNLGLLMRQLCGRGTPRGLQGRRLDARSLHVALLMLSVRFWMTIGALLAYCRRPPRVLHPHPAWAIA